jgi:hypothetical protein
MLRTLKSLIALILLAGWGVAALSVHVVRITDDHYWIGVVPKNRLGIADTYVDVTQWTAADVYAHPDLVRRLIATDKGSWLSHVVEPSLLPAVLEEGPAATQPAADAKSGRKTPVRPAR